MKNRSPVVWRTNGCCYVDEDGENLIFFCDHFEIYTGVFMEYREELLKVLVPMQHEVENAAFSDDEDMDETEDVDMTM